jgi:chromosome partitioning protein
LRTLVIGNSKGGAGKTTLAVNLAAGLARDGKRVLLVDLDPQGNATSWLFGVGGAPGKGIAEALLERRLTAENIHPVPERPGLALAPSTRALATADLTLASATGGQAILRRLLERQAGDWDFAIIDTPPAVGVYVVSAIVAADGVLAPFPAAFLSFAGLRVLEQTVDEAREYLGSSAKVLGYVLFGADAREGVTAEARGLVESERPGMLLKAEVRVSTAAKTSPARRRTAFDAGEDPRGAEDYPAILRETLARLEGRKGKAHGA